jgi:DNA topoisomerase-1
MNVSKFLVESNFCFVDPKFTSNMEETLDKIAQKEDNKLAALTEFWDRLKLDIINAKGAKEKMNQTSFKCECGSSLVKKHSKFGDFLGCSNYPDCKKIYNIGEDGGPVEKVKKELNESEHKCPNCGEKLLIRMGKKNNEYLGCRNWKDEDCKGFFNMDGEKMEFKKKSFKKFKKWGKKKSEDSEE